MKKNFSIVVIILGIALLIGGMSWMVDTFSEEKNLITPTPTGLVTPTPAEQGGEQKVTPTKAPATPTASQSPTEEVTPEPSPEMTPEATPEVTEPVRPGRLTEEEAITFLKTISADKLKLPKDIGAYELEADSWTSNILGTVECYCINVLAPEGGLVGMFYVAVDGSAVYRLNEDEAFVKISE